MIMREREGLLMEKCDGKGLTHELLLMRTRGQYRDLG